MIFFFEREHFIQIQNKRVYFYFRTDAYLRHQPTVVQASSVCPIAIAKVRRLCRRLVASLLGHRLLPRLVIANRNGDTNQRHTAHKK